MSAFTLKASHIQHLTDARYFAAWNARYLCIEVHEDLSEMDIFKFREIATWVEGPLMVGTFTNNFPKDKISYFKDALQLDKIELKGKIHELQDREADIYHIVLEQHNSPADIAAFQGIKPQAEIVLDFVTNNITFETWAMESNPGVFYYVDMDTDKLVSLILKHQLNIQLAGGEEEKVGVKRYDELDEILEGIETLIFD